MATELKKSIMKKELRKWKIYSFVFLLVIFSLVSCEEEKADKTYTGLEGVFSCEENSPYTGYRKYITEIDKVTGQDNVFIISNFHNQGHAEFIYVNLQHDSVLLIENQVISNLFINGEGVVNDRFNEIKLIYNVDDGNQEIEYFAIYKR